MTIRGGGRPRDPHAQPVRYDDEHYAYEPAPTDPRIRDALEARFQNEAFTTRAVLLRHDSLFSADDWRHLLAAF